MKKLRIGVLGGTRGLDFMSRVLLNHPLAEVTAICESFPALREKIEGELQGMNSSARVFQSFDDMLASGIDAVILANFANAHAPFAIRALDAGVHVFSESVPVQTMQEAVGLCEAVERSGKIYAYGENYCYLPHMLEVRRIFDGGSMGNIMHAEGDFINDCSFKWHLLTRGDRTHWRNHVPSTFYCTHSVGPLFFATGRRALTVVGMETQRMPHMAEVGARSASGAMEIMQLDNGGMAKSINGNHRRGYTASYRLIAENGTIETDPYEFGTLRFFRPDAQSPGFYARQTLAGPWKFDAVELYSAKDMAGMGSFELADVHVINVFIQSVLGNENARKYMIDVYQALDMCLVGTLAYRSILQGSMPVAIPDMRNPAEREAWRSDSRSTDPAVSPGDQLLPSCRDGFVDVPDEVYQRVQDWFGRTPITSGGH